MDQRPPSSRPKTSSGRPGSSRRPKTAGRGDGERPPTRQLPVRPPSRIGVDAINSDNVAISERAISRGNPMNPPTSAMVLNYFYFNESSDGEENAPAMFPFEVFPEEPRIEKTISSHNKKMLATGGFTFYFGYSTTLHVKQANGNIN
uniref:Uncharacterized protein n=1 Tax=Ditylenchus dipsaci TaxID=166011 RepID=A0A915CTU2_9BILA